MTGCPGAASILQCSIGVKLHLDTNLGGDIDDLQALAYLLGSPEVELTGITTAAEDAGRRAGYVWRALELGNRVDIPVAAGIDVTSGPQNTSEAACITACLLVTLKARVRARPRRVRRGPGTTPPKPARAAEESR
jgi:hypothetical protein